MEFHEMCFKWKNQNTLSENLFRQINSKSISKIKCCFHEIFAKKCESEFRNFHSTVWKKPTFSNSFVQHKNDFRKFVSSKSNDDVLCTGPTLLGNIEIFRQTVSYLNNTYKRQYVRVIFSQSPKKYFVKSTI